MSICGQVIAYIYFKYIYIDAQYEIWWNKDAEFSVISLYVSIGMFSKMFSIVCADIWFSFVINSTVHYKYDISYMGLRGLRSILSTVRFRRNMWPPSHSTMSWAPLLFYCPHCHVSQYVWELSCSPCGEITAETSNWPLTHSEYVWHTVTAEWMILLMWLSFVMQGIFSKCSKIQEATVTEDKLKNPICNQNPHRNGLQFERKVAMHPPKAHFSLLCVGNTCQVNR